MNKMFTCDSDTAIAIRVPTRRFPLLFWCMIVWVYEASRNVSVVNGHTFICGRRIRPNFQKQEVSTVMPSNSLPTTERRTMIDFQETIPIRWGTSPMECAKHLTQRLETQLRSDVERWVSTRIQKQSWRTQSNRNTCVHPKRNEFAHR